MNLKNTKMNLKKNLLEQWLPLQGVVLTAKGHDGTFRGNGSIFYPDVGDDIWLYIYVKMSLSCAPKICSFYYM